MYETTHGVHDALFQSLGFNAVNEVASKSALDSVAALGMQAMVWVGDYDGDTCAFTSSDSAIAAAVDAIKGHPAVLGYYVADEPEQALQNCPDLTQQLKARSDLIRLHDPAKPTYIVVSNSAYVPGGTIEWYPYHYFVGTADILGLDIYPCRQPASSPCDFADIDRAIAAASSQGVPHYYAVIQDFEDSTWRRPSPDELKTEFDHWASSRMEGSFIFSWDWQGNSLDGNTAHYDVFKFENARVFGSTEGQARRRQLAANRAGASARASNRSVFPSTIRSAAIGPSAPLVSMPAPPWPASQKKPRTRGSSPTTGMRSGAKVRSPDHLRRSVCGTSDGASPASRARPRAITSSSGRASHGSIGSSSIGLSSRPPDSGAK